MTITALIWTLSEANVKPNVANLLSLPKWEDNVKEEKILSSLTLGRSNIQGIIFRDTLLASIYNEAVMPYQYTHLCVYKIDHM